MTRTQSDKPPATAAATVAATSLSRAYRAKVQAKLDEDYDGRLHLVLLIMCSSVGVLAPLLFLDDPSTPLIATVVPASLLYANFVEYALHRWGGHEISWQNTAMKKFHKYHAIVHHSYFGGGDWRTEGDRDLYFILFPAWIYVLWVCCGAVPLVLLSWLSGPTSNVNGWLLAVSCGSFALVQYEVLHSFGHNALPAAMQRAFARCPPLVRIQRRHRIHHSKGKCNFCITWPLADMAFGTLDETVPASEDGVVAE